MNSGASGIVSGAKFIPAMENPIINTGEGAESPLPEHLIQLPGSRQWALWRCMGLRGAGFPAVLVLNLSVPECATTADRLTQAEETAQQAGDEALRAVMEDLGALRRNMEWDNWEKRKPLLKAKRSLEKGKLPKPLGFAHAGSEAIKAFRDACAQLDSARADFYQAFEAARVQISEAIRQVIRMNRFREAIIWQNRRAFHTSIEPLIQRPVGALRSRERQKEKMVARYLQRYCAKNDAIGFFGPVGWARLVSQEKALVVQPGPNLLAERNVYFEQWCIDTLAETLAKNESLRPWFTPRRIPLIHVEGTTLYRPSENPIQIFPELAAVLQACDGDRMAKEIAADLLQTPGIELRSEGEVYELFELLYAQELILWTFEIPLMPHPERALRRLLERIEENHLRRPALEALDELEDAGSAVARAAGDAKKLDQALGKLEATFTRLTGEASTRSAGQTYAGRTLVYEDCRRDVEVHVGTEILKSLGPPLSLLLTSARWLTFEAAAVYRKIFGEMYTELVRHTGSPIIDLTSFWHRARPLLLHMPDAPNIYLADLQSNFQDRWTDILNVPEGQHCVQRTSEELGPRVLSAFDAPTPGWKIARYHSPDVMIAADSVETIQQGHYQFVLGEVHVGMNTLRNPAHVAQHPSPRELFQALDLDLPEPRIVPVAPREWERTTSRTYDALVSDKDFRLLFTVDACVVPKSQALPIGSLVVENGESELVVRTRDGRLSVDIIEFFADALSLLAGNLLQILPPCSHTPRVTIDRLVVCRETWRFPTAEIPFADSSVEADCFLKARRWARTHNLPRFIFVKAPVEEKPFFVDFDSPILVSVFAKTIRRTIKDGLKERLITVTEMLPTLDQTWLTDAQGQRYTSEFRIVAVDLAV